MMTKSEIAQINERIAGIQRIIIYLRKQQDDLFSNRKQQSKAYKTIVDEIKDAKKRIQRLEKAKAG